jgi:predicted Zn-dependent peptidase
MGDQVHTEKLESGLTVIVKHVPNKVVTLDMWVNTGSCNEGAHDNGISHFLEHMMFKGTRRFKPGDLDKVIMNVGGVWNAGTSKDFTHYYVTVASPFFATALDVLADMIQDSQIDAAEFDREKQVILEEYRRKQDSPFGLIFDELYEELYEQGPYRQSVLGSFESISALDRDAMYEYYRQRYSASNMVLVIVGDVEVEEVIPQAREAFKNVSPGSVPANQVPPTKFAPGHQRVISQDVNETYLAIGWPGPALDAPTEVLAMDIAFTILCEGRSSRLYRSLKEEKKIVNSIGGGFPTHKFESLTYVNATLEEENLDLVIEEIHAEVARLWTHPPTPAEMAKARRIIRNSFIFGMETNTGQSSTIGYYFTLTGSTDFLEHYLDRLDAITSEQVAQVVQQYLKNEGVSVTVIPNETSKVAAA